MEKIRFALVGCGRIGERHAAQIHSKGKLEAVCDIDENRAKRFSQEYGCNLYTDIDSLLQQEMEIDVVVICSPNGLHAEHVIKSLHAGTHVLCEKPMAIRSKDCREMIQAAEKMNKHLFIIKQNRYNPPVAAIKEALDKNWLGEIYSVQLTCFWNRGDEYYKHDPWKGTLTLDGGTLFTQFSHFIDLLYWLFGDVQAVAAITRNYAHKSIEFEDSGAALLAFNSGAIGTVNFSINSYQRNMEGSLTILGENGTVKIGGQYLNTLEYQHIKDHHITLGDEGNPPNRYGTYEGSMSNHDKVYDNVIGVLQRDEKVSTNFFEGLKTVEIIEKIYAAANKNTMS